MVALPCVVITHCRSVPGSPKWRGCPAQQEHAELLQGWTELCLHISTTVMTIAKCNLQQYAVRTRAYCVCSTFVCVGPDS